MNSAEDVEPPVVGGHDERLIRAFDRVARLGIDLEEDDGLSDRESAAVRAFAALHQDAAPAPAPEAPETTAWSEPPSSPEPPEPAAWAEPASSSEPPHPAAWAEPPASPAPPHPAAWAEPPASPAPPQPAAWAEPSSPSEEPSPSARPSSSLPPLASGPPIAAATAPPAAPPDDGPLRPDAVLRSRRFTPRDDEYPGGNGSDGIEVEVPPAPASTPSPSARPSDPSSAPPVAPASGPAPATPQPAPEAGATTPTETAAPAEAAAFEPPARAGDSYLLDVAALGVASGAFVWPWAWPAVVVVCVVIGAVVSSVAAKGPSVAALARRGARHVLAWLRPRALMGGAVVIARTALVAVVAPALVCAGWWIITEGLDGAFVAARIGVWTHGLRVVAAVACFVLIVGVGEARTRRIARVRRVAGQLGVTAVTAIAAVVVVAALAVIAVGPRAGGGWSSADDGLGWVPARFQDNVDRLRDDVVSAEVHAASGCLSDHQGVTWRATYTTGNPLLADDVVRLTAEEDADAPSPAHLATAAAALHNQVAPWVEAIELEVDGDTVVVLDRTRLPGGRPTVEAGDLVAAASSGGGRLVEGADGFDRAVALSCSAAPLP